MESVRSDFGASLGFAKNTASECSFRCSSVGYHQPERLARLIGEVQDVIDSGCDSVMVYRFSGRIGDARMRIGRRQTHEVGDPWIL